MAATWEESDATDLVADDCVMWFQIPRVMDAAFFWLGCLQPRQGMRGHGSCRSESLTDHSHPTHSSVCGRDAAAWCRCAGMAALLAGTWTALAVRRAPNRQSPSMCVVLQVQIRKERQVQISTPPASGSGHAGAWETNMEGNTVQPWP